LGWGAEPFRVKLRRNSASNKGNGAFNIWRLGTITISMPPGGLFSRKISRATRFARLRSTALPSFLEAETPNRVSGDGALLTRKTVMNWP